MANETLISQALALAPTNLFIGGKWRAAEGGGTFDVIDPATQEVIAHVADATTGDALAALDAAVAAQADWAATAPRKRSDILRRAFELTNKHAEDLAALITVEMGKPLADARGEVTYSNEYVRFYAEQATRIGGRTGLTPEGNLHLFTERRPVGPCFFVTPWNFPLGMATRKIAPALAAGCTCVIKVASFTPLSALAFVKILEDAGVPAGVVNILTSSHSGAISAAILADERLRKVSFTGSTEVGRVILQEASQNVLKTSMELGGCAPFIVFDDADIDRAVEGAVAAKVRSNGEACNAANTFYVQRGVAKEFSEKLGKAFGAMHAGNGFEPGSDLGTLVSKGQRDIVAELVDDAILHGAKVLAGGQVPEGKGFFYPATVLADVPLGTKILTTEIFGPVAPIAVFDTEEQVVELANQTIFGLQGYLHTGDLARVFRMLPQLEIGLMSINTGTISNAAAPFGGMKQSGLGREGGPEGIEEYLETQYVAYPTK